MFLGLSDWDFCCLRGEAICTEMPEVLARRFFWPLMCIDSCYSIRLYAVEFFFHASEGECFYGDQCRYLHIGVGASCPGMKVWCKCSCLNCSCSFPSFYSWIHGAEPDEFHDFTHKGCTTCKRNSNGAVFWGHFCSWHRQPLTVYHKDSFSGFITTSTSRSNVLVCNHRNRSTGFSHKMHILTVYTRFLLNHIKHFSHPLTSGLIVFLCATTAGWSAQAGARQCAAIFPSVLASRDVWPFNVIIFCFCVFDMCRISMGVHFINPIFFVTVILVESAKTWETKFQWGSGVSLNLKTGDPVCFKWATAVSYFDEKMLWQSVA